MILEVENKLFIKTIDLGHSVVHLRNDGIVQVNFADDVEMDKKESEEVVDAIGKLTDGKKSLVLNIGGVNTTVTASTGVGMGAAGPTPQPNSVSAAMNRSVEGFVYIKPPEIASLPFASTWFNLGQRIERCRPKMRPVEPKNSAPSQRWGMIDGSQRKVGRRSSCGDGKERGKGAR